MRYSLIFLACLASRVDGFWMMMMKDKDAEGQMMASAASAIREPADATSSSTPPKGVDKPEESSLCISPDELEKAIEQAKQAENAREQAQDAEKRAHEGLRAAQEALKAALDAEKKGKELLKAAQDEVVDLHKSLKKQSSEIERSLNAAERVEKFHQEILQELSEINANSENQFQVLKSQIEAEMQRQREKLRVDRVTAQRIDELEKEKTGYLGELKALHQLYERLDKKYDAKMEQEEEEKLAYFAKSLDQEVAKIVGEREMEWEEKLATLQKELEERAERQAQSFQRARDKEASALNQMIEDVQRELEKAMEKANEHEADIKAEHAKALELAEENTLKRLDKLRQEVEAEATKEAAAVKKLHDQEVTQLRSEIAKSNQETREALKKSKQLDSNLKLTNEDRENEKRKYDEIIEGLKKELREAHEETAYWMKAFAKRAYFNSTQLGEDIAKFAEEAQVLATQTAKDTISQTQTYVNQQTDQLTKAMDPYTRQAGDFYRATLEKHVKAADAAARPLYDKHVAPVVADAQLFQRQKSAEFWKMIDDGFEELVSLAQKRCKTSKKEIEKAPAMIRERMQKVCKDPSVVIRDALRMLAVIIIILLRKTIWRLVWGTVRVCFQVIWYFVSFRFLRSSRPVPDDGTDAQTESKTPKPAAQ